MAPVRWLKAYFHERFGERVQKIPVDAGFSCPNRDGTLSRDGCAFCLPASFSPFYCSAEKPLARQLQEGTAFFSRKYGARKFLAYFQAFSGTYAPLADLERLLLEALDFPGVVGLIIATRPDCLGPEIIRLLAGLTSRAFIGVELGIESCRDDILTRLNRHHTFAQVQQAVWSCAEAEIFTGGHLMSGLPGEPDDEPLISAEHLSALPIRSLKLHHLQILKGTPLAAEYLAHPDRFPRYPPDRYLDRLIDFLEHLRPDICIDRISARAPRDLILFPDWGGISAGDLGKSLRDRMTDRHSRQGLRWRISS